MGKGARKGPITYPLNNDGIKGRSPDGDQEKGISDKGKGKRKHYKDGPYTQGSTKGKGYQKSWSGKAGVNQATWIPGGQTRKEKNQGKEDKNQEISPKDNRSQDRLEKKDTQTLEETGAGQENRKRLKNPLEQEEDVTAMLTGVQKIKKRKLEIESNLKEIEKGQEKLVKRAQELKRELHIANRRLQKYASVKAIAMATHDKEQRKDDEPHEMERWKDSKTPRPISKNATGKQNNTERVKIRIDSKR